MNGRNLRYELFFYLGILLICAPFMKTNTVYLPLVFLGAWGLRRFAAFAEDNRPITLFRVRLVNTVLANRSLTVGLILAVAFAATLRLLQLSDGCADLCHPLRHPGHGAQYHRGDDRGAGARLHRLLRGGSLYHRHPDRQVCPLRFLGGAAAFRAGRHALRYPAGYSGPAAQRGLPGGGDTWFRRDHPHLPHQSERTDRRAERHPGDQAPFIRPLHP